MQGEGSLGRDFWLFRFGQLLSVVGDSCASIALAWWLLEKTGSAIAMSSVLAPSMFVEIGLLPFLGPVGDWFDRKKLILLADSWRGVLFLLLGLMAALNVFILPSVIVVYVLAGAGTALFSAVSSSIVPQLVSPEQLPAAMEQTQAVNAVGKILGGVLGGIAVSVLGVGGAFFVNAASYFAAVLATALIAAETRPTAREDARRGLKAFKDDFEGGFIFLFRAPVLLMIAVVAMALNFLILPALTVVLPILVKEGRGLPPWFLGALESSIGIGTVIGAWATGWFGRRIRMDRVVVLGVVLLGSTLAVIPWIPDLALPLAMMLLFGVGGSLANVPLMTQVTLATPQGLLSRMSSILTFLCGLAAPVGVAVVGRIIPWLGLSATMTVMGAVAVVVAPLLFVVPRFSLLMCASPAETERFVSEHFPKALKPF